MTRKLITRHILIRLAFLLGPILSLHYTLQYYNVQERIYDRVTRAIADKFSSPPVYNYTEFINLTSRVFYPWKDDENCKNFSIRLAKQNTFPTRALVSFPGSGNSWIRYLLEGSSGLFTGSVYKDHRLNKLGYYGEYQKPTDGTTAVQKTHFENYEIFEWRGILVIRNPYDSLRSYWNFWNSGGNHVAYANITEGSSTKKWKSTIAYWLGRWAKLHTQWVENSDDSLLIVIYEEVKSNPEKEIRKMLEYLKLPVDEDRLACTLSNIEGSVHRPPSNSSYRQVLTFSDDQASRIQASLDSLNELLQKKQFNLYLNYTDKYKTT